ncbi:MAG: sulfatase [Anaerolineae bacterium]|nr:sulfatase [Anaerolineae bacterium]MCA9891406.1 sulfatase [Anaerolineae bacterium]MCB9458684.1 sulfatase [Anaerolineaceae bacterium]
MKAVMVMFDSLNRHMLPPYGCEWVHAPNFERLSQLTITFDNYYIGSMPCMPARRELHTGRYNFLHRSWGPLEPFDDSMPQILTENGIYTHLITDHMHYFEDGGATYHNRYNSWELNRGQEGDQWKGHVEPHVNIPPITRIKLNDQTDRMWQHEFVNRAYMPTQEDQPQAKTFSQGLHFIRSNHQADNWFLQIETFDPHEPFFTHQKYKDLYPHEYNGTTFDWPSYGPVVELPEAVEHVRNEYAALVTMCDDYLGKVLDLFDKLDMWKDTLLIVITDHGYLLGEHDWWAKNRMPWYNELANIPLFIWDPRYGGRNERRQSLVQMIDMPATLLEFFDIERPKDMLGVPLRETIASDQPVREYALFGLMGSHINITDGHYVYMRAPEAGHNEPLYEYTLMPTHLRKRFDVDEFVDLELAGPFDFTKSIQVMKMSARPFLQLHDFKTLLFYLESDPGQKSPLDDPEVEARMIKNMVRLMQENDAPLEQYERMNLQNWVSA